MSPRNRWPPRRRKAKNRRASGDDDRAHPRLRHRTRGSLAGRIYRSWPSQSASPRSWHGREAAFSGRCARPRRDTTSARGGQDLDTAVVWASEGIDLIHDVEPAGTIGAPDRRRGGGGAGAALRLARSRASSRMRTMWRASRPAASAIWWRQLVPQAARSVSGGGRAHFRQDAEFADLERHLMVLGLVAKRAGHAAAGRIRRSRPSDPGSAAML